MRGASQQATETAARHSTVPTAPAAEERDERYWAGWLDGRAVGLQVGWNRGRHDAIEAAARDRAEEILHELAVTCGEWAHREAEQRHGSAWASMFEEAAS